MKKLKYILSIAFVIILVVTMIFINRENKEYESTIYAMNTVMTIKAYGPNAQKGITAAVSEIYRLEHELSVTEPSSKIYEINNASGEPVELVQQKASNDVGDTSDTSALLKESVYISKLTDGAFDISIYPIVKAWGFTEDEFRVPTEEEIKELLNMVGYESIIINDATGSAGVQIPAGFMIDLGGIAKGYAADRVRDILVESGVKNAIINLGGNVLTLGSNPGLGDWKIGIKNPLSDGDIATTVTANNKAVVTSGSYERYFEKDGVRYWHILDPKTGYPAKSGIASVTIIADSSTYADAMSTASFVMGVDKTEELYRQCGDFDYVIVTESGKICSSLNE